MKQELRSRALQRRIEAKMAERGVEYVWTDTGPDFIGFTCRHGGCWMTPREFAFYLGLGRLAAADLEALAALWPGIVALRRAKAA